MKPLASSPPSAARPTPPVDPASPRKRGPTGPPHGQRLSAAFEAIGTFPGLAETQNRLLSTLDGPTVTREGLADLLETDLGFAIGLLRTVEEPSAVCTIPEALDRGDLAALRERIQTTRTLDFFGRDVGWGQEPTAHRRHVIAVRSAVRQIAGLTEGIDVELVSTAALFHDVGKLVLRRANAGDGERLPIDGGTPEIRLRDERQRLGVDHTLVGGVLLRRWGLGPRLVRLVERHHSDDDDPQLATLRLADLVAHHGQGAPVSPQVLTRVSRRIGLTNTDLRGLLFDAGSPAPRRGQKRLPSPLSARESEVLARLAAGRVYKQIAGDLDLSTSTVRTHLHNIYRKLGAVDRAQAVLIAVERGWL